MLYVTVKDNFCFVNLFRMYKNSSFWICVFKSHTWLISLTGLTLYTFWKAEVLKGILFLNLVKSSGGSQLLGILAKNFVTYFSNAFSDNDAYKKILLCIICYELNILNKLILLFNQFNFHFDERFKLLV